MTPEFLTAQENEIKALWESGDIPYLCHLMGGNELILEHIFQDIHPDDFVFASHRCHFHYSLHGGTDLVEKVLAGKSMFLYLPNFICSAIVGGTLAMAAGMALSFKLKKSSRKVWAFCGDGATDQGCFWEAVRFAEGRNLPITYVVEDNGAQCGVSGEIRWGGRVPMMKAILDSPKVRYYRYAPSYPHAGTLDSKGVPIRPSLKWKPEPPSSLPAPP